MAAIIGGRKAGCYTVVMNLSTALNRVLRPAQRKDVRDLVAFELGARRASARQMLSWMRVNMPSAADRVDDMLFPEPFRD